MQVYNEGILSKSKCDYPENNEKSSSITNLFVLQSFNWRCGFRWEFAKDL